MRSETKRLIKVKSRCSRYLKAVLSASISASLFFQGRDHAAFIKLRGAGLSIFNSVTWHPRLIVVYAATAWLTIRWPSYRILDATVKTMWHRSALRLQLIQLKSAAAPAVNFRRPVNSVQRVTNFVTFPYLSRQSYVTHLMAARNCACNLIIPPAN